MKQQESYIPKKKNSQGKSFPSTARKIGYVVVIIIMFVILYLVRHVMDWKVNFLTADFSKVLFYIELSIYANIVANILFIFYDNRWFKYLMQTITDLTGALSLIMFYVIFPIVLANENWLKWIRIGLLVLFVLTVISAIVNLIKGLRYLLKEPEAV